MKIGILTFFYADNYGALLQAYALQKYIQSGGHDVSFLDYIPESEKNFYSRKFRDISSIKGAVKKAISNYERRDSAEIFQSFRRKYFKLEPYEKAIEKCDLLITGSDQVWNEKIVKDLEPYLFFEKKSSAVKISYAASVGDIPISDEAKVKLLKYLKTFSGISVREKSAEEALKGLGIPCVTVVDPVFLLDKNSWLSFAHCPDRFNHSERYVLVYLLRPNRNIVSKANDFARIHNLKLYYIHPMGKRIKLLSGKRIKYVGPEEFVWLISHADIVFTNSFHAVSFCCMLEKQFYHLQGEDMGNRVASLLSAVEIKSTEWGGTVAVLGKAFCSMRDCSKQFLKNYIER